MPSESVRYRPTQAELDAANAEAAQYGEPPFTLDEMESARIFADYTDARRHGRQDREAWLALCSCNGVRADLEECIEALEFLLDARVFEDRSWMKASTR